GGCRPSRPSPAARGRRTAARRPPRTSVTRHATGTRTKGRPRRRLEGMPLDFAYEDHTLANGLRVIVQPDDTTPTVTVNLWVGVGSRHEEAGRTGFAHLFEHLMFQGSEHVANGEHFQALMGGRGRLNATSWDDRA